MALKLVEPWVNRAPVTSATVVMMSSAMISVAPLSSRSPRRRVFIRCLRSAETVVV